jgi:putative Ca2+/H+ antiporter (TMEM165/GDT1 family)
MTFDLSVFMTTLSMVLIMEMGDKTQLLVMACASKYKPRQVLMGITMAIVLLNLLAVALGSVIGGIKMIQDIVKAAASVLFIFFGLLSLREEEGEESCSTRGARNAVIGVVVAFFLAEIGDKTQLSTFSFAAMYPGSPISVFAGATLALIAADCIGLIAGAIALKYIPKRILSYISAALFVIFGLMSGWTTLTENFSLPVYTAMIIMGATVLLAVMAAAVILMGQKKKKPRH